MVNLEEARPRSVPGAPSGGKDGNGPGSHLARGLVRTPRTMRRKDPIASGGFGMRPDPLGREAACSDSEEIHSSDVRLLMKCACACVSFAQLS